MGWREDLDDLWDPPAPPHTCEDGQVKWNGGNCVVLCRICSVILRAATDVDLGRTS